MTYALISQKGVQEKTKILQLPQICARWWEAGTLSLLDDLVLLRSLMITQRIPYVLVLQEWNRPCQGSYLLDFAHNQLTRLILRMLSAENNIHTWSRSPQ